MSEIIDEDDPLLNTAIIAVRQAKKASISFIQRKLKIGYNRAARLVERMEEMGIISPFDESGKRTVLTVLNQTTVGNTMPEMNYDTFFTASENVGKDLLATMIDELKAAPDVWQKLSKSQQDDVLMRVKNRIDQAVTKAVTIIASKDRPVLKAHLKKVTFSDSGVDGQVIMSKKQEGRHDLADSQGEDILIVITNINEFTQTMNEVEGEEDQRSMF